MKAFQILLSVFIAGMLLAPPFIKKLYSLYGGEGFVVLAFPCNDFGNQEPGSNSEIASFCKTEYGISFPLMARIAIKGEDRHPLYKWLTE